MTRGKLKELAALGMTAVLACGVFTGCGDSNKDDLGNVYGDYIGLEYTEEDASVSDDDVTERLDSMVESLGEYKQITKGKVETGNIISVDYSGKVDNKEVEECVGEDMLFEVGKDDEQLNFSGFSEACLGKTPGKKKIVFTSKLPKDFSNEDVAGKDCTFTVKINYIQGDLEIPELNDDLINKQTDGEYTTVDDYKKFLKEQMELTAKEDAKYEIEKQLLNNIRANSEFNKVDTELIAKYKKDYKTYYEDMATQYEIDLDTYISYMGMTNDEFEEAKQKNAEISAKEEMIVNFIADKEKLELTDDEYDKHLDKLVTQYGYDSRGDLESDIKDNDLEENIKYTALKSKVIDFLKEKGKKVDKLSKDYSNIDGEDTDKSESSDESTEATASSDETSSDETTKEKSDADESEASSNESETPESTEATADDETTTDESESKSESESSDEDTETAESETSDSETKEDAE